MQVELFNCKSGECTAFSLISSAAWEECVELQVTPKDIWLKNSSTIIVPYDRIEILVHEEGVPIGGCILMEDDYDPHVGKCACIGYTYVFPLYRNKGVARKLMREAIKYTRDKGLTVLKYSHRICDWKYEILYIKV
jgi:GNAT superfamily N-acetyltransferase